MAYSFTNNAEGGVDGQAVGIGDPGSGDSFTNVSIAAGSSFNYSAAAAYKGALGYAIRTTSAVKAFARWTVSPNSSVMRLRAYVNVHQWLGVQWFQMLGPSGATAGIAGYIQLSGTGQVQIIESGGTVKATTDPIPKDQWIRLESIWVAGTTAGSARLAFFDGDSLTPLYDTGVVTISTSASFTGFNFGKSNGSGIWTGGFDIDELASDDADSVNFIGPASLTFTDADAFAASSSFSIGGSPLSQAGALSLAASSSAVFGGVRSQQSVLSMSAVPSLSVAAVRSQLSSLAVAASATLSIQNSPTASLVAAVVASLSVSGSRSTSAAETLAAASGLVIGATRQQNAVWAVTGAAAATIGSLRTQPGGVVLAGVGGLLVSTGPSVGLAVRATPALVINAVRTQFATVLFQGVSGLVEFVVVTEQIHTWHRVVAVVLDNGGRIAVIDPSSVTAELLSVGAIAVVNP